MERTTRGRPELDLTKLLQTPRRCRVIRNRQVHIEQFRHRTQESLGLAQRQVEDHADRQRCLDRDIRVATLPARLAGRCCPPGVQRFCGKPHCQVTSPSQADLVFTNFSPGIETSYACTAVALGCASITAPCRGQVTYYEPNREPCINAPAMRLRHHAILFLLCGCAASQRFTPPRDERSGEVYYYRPSHPILYGCP